MDEAPKSLKITSVSVEDAAKVLSSAYGRRIDADQIRAVVEAGNLAGEDGTFSLVDYVAYLAGEAGRGQAN